MKDKIQRRLAHACRRHSHEKNAPVVAVAASAFVVVTSVTVAKGSSKSRLSSGPLDHNPRARLRLNEGIIPSDASPAYVFANYNYD